MYDDINQIVNLTPTNIIQTDDTLDFEFSDGSSAKFYHSQSCCENVYIAETIGDLDDLLNVPLLSVEEKINPENPPKYSDYDDDSQTWTFYTFRSIKGSVDVRWFGSSNGCYSESVDFDFTPKEI